VIVILFKEQVKGENSRRVKLIHLEEGQADRCNEAWQSQASSPSKAPHKLTGERRTVQFGGRENHTMGSSFMIILENLAPGTKEKSEIVKIVNLSNLQNMR